MFYSATYPSCTAISTSAIRDRDHGFSCGIISPRMKFARQQGLGMKRQYQELGALLLDSAVHLFTWGCSFYLDFVAQGCGMGCEQRMAALSSGPNSCQLLERGGWRLTGCNTIMGQSGAARPEHSGGRGNTWRGLINGTGSVSS